MKILFDTHFLIWAATHPDRLPTAVLELISDTSNSVAFSIISTWEVAIKYALKRPDFTLPPQDFHEWCLDQRFEELPLKALHTYELFSLPPHHRDPFDRIMVAQARVENMKLLTHDRKLAQYGSPIEVV